MTALPVEWVLVIFYGPSAHRATYGRLKGTKYTKDYIQLSKKDDFVSSITNLFPPASDGTESVPLTYKWPQDTTPGQIIFRSADRPHLAWETKLGAPKAWKMSSAPSEATAETIPGDPTHLASASAENELALLESRDAGQPYLMAIKLRDEPRTLHLRAYLESPGERYAWADLQLTPKEIQSLAANTSQNSALAWTIIQSGGTAPSETIKDALSQLTASEHSISVVDDLADEAGQALATYLEHPAYGLFFDPSRNHDAWLQPIPLSEKITASLPVLSEYLNARFPRISLEDAVAETLEVSAEEVEAFSEQIKKKSFEVPDSHATTKTRGSAQRAFSQAVKSNYGFRCAITGINTMDFLVAAHIVPWSEDQSIRLDPSNGICLSLLVDRAFETGYLLIEDDLTIRVNPEKIGDDRALLVQFQKYDGQKLSTPQDAAPRTEYLQRRRAQVLSTD
tara:strand:+ start:2580 stop:3935 length:1356 start_codon:yes stop_codon:yes gene_type:complete